MSNESKPTKQEVLNIPKTSLATIIKNINDVKTKVDILLDTSDSLGKIKAIEADIILEMEFGIVQSPSLHSSLRDWWHNILRQHGRFSCYAIFLLLPSDKEAIRYLTDYSRELTIVSENNCLVAILSKTDFRVKDFDEKILRTAVDEQISEGYSVKVAKLFDIDIAEFPCVVIFKDIRSPEHVLIMLKNMSGEEIATKMRTIFSVIQKAVDKKENPLTALKNQQNAESLSKIGKNVISELRTFTGKTFESVVDAWIKSSIK